MSAVHSLGAAVLLTVLAASAPAQTPPAPATPPKPAAPAPPVAPAPPAPPAVPAAPAAPTAPAFDVKIVDLPAVHAVILPMKGSYMQHPDAFSRLGSFLSAHGITPQGSIFARYYSDPSVGEANLVWEVGIAVPAGTTAEAPFEIKDIPASLTAVHDHHGALEALGGAWGTMLQWASTNGYQLSGPPTQVFKGDMTAGAPQVEMQVAVQK
jgi:DNA gyrase inhibitor GyrI